ncbi:MAG: glucokinase, partial [Pseudomonadota bacterium]
MQLSANAIVADIGGTNARFALVTPNWFLLDIKVLSCADYPGFADAFQAYRETLGGETIQAAAIAMPNPVDGDHIQMTNHHWSFSIQQTRQELGLDKFLVLNDFVALALSIPFLTDADKQQTGGELPVEDAAIALLGPGPGLGVGGLMQIDERWHPIPSEGGHATFSPTNKREFALNQVLQQRFGHVSFERTASGPGLQNLYQAICEVDDAKANMTLSPGDITSQA